MLFFYTKTIQIYFVWLLYLQLFKGILCISNETDKRADKEDDKEDLTVKSNNWRMIGKVTKIGRRTIKKKTAGKGAS